MKKRLNRSLILVLILSAVAISGSSNRIMHAATFAPAEADADGTVGFSSFFDTSTGSPGSGAYVPPLNVDVPDGNDQAIRAGRFGPGNAVGGAATNQVALIHWNTSSVPLGSTVTGVTVTLYQLSQATTTTYPIFVTTGAWSESQLNGSITSPPPGAVVTAGSGSILSVPGKGTTVGTATLSVNPGLNSFSSAALDAEVQAWVAQPSANFGLQMESSSYGANPRGTQIASREHATQPGPELTFTYTAPQFYFTGDQDAVWDTNNAGNTNWATDVTGATNTTVPTSADRVVLAANNATVANLNMTLGAPSSVNGLYLTGTVGTSNSVTVGGSNALTIGAGGMTTDTGQAGHSISAPVVLSASQVWDNEGTNALSVSNTVNLGANTLNLAGPGAINISGVISGAGGVTAKGTGTVSLNAGNTYTGITNILGGTLTIGSIANGGLPSEIGQSTSSAANLVLFNGKLKYTGSSATTNRGFTLSNHGVNTIEVTTAGTTLDFDGALTNLGHLVKTGPGTLELSVAHASRTSVSTTSQPFTRIDGGQITVKASSALGDSTTANWMPVNINNTGMLEINGTGLALNNGMSVNINHGGTFRSNGTNTSNARVSVGATGTVDATLSTVGSGDIFTIGNAANEVTGGSATSTLHVAGPGTVLLQQNSNYIGNWSLDAGTTLLQTSATPLGATSARTLALNGGTLRANYAANQSFTSGAGNNVSVAANSTITSDRSALGAGVTYTFGNLGIGANTLNIAGGATNVNSGTAGVTFGATTLSGNAAFNVTNPGAGGVTLLTLGAIGQTGGARSLTKSGNGQLSLTAVSNTYTGNTIVNGGTLLLANSGTSNNIPGSPLITLATGTTLNTTGLSGGNLTLANGQTLKGTGTVTGALTVALGSTISAGNSPGTMPTGAQTWNPGGNNAVEINDAAGTSGSDPGWDLLAITGILNVSSLSATNEFNIVLTSLNLSNVPADAANFSSTGTYAWKFADSNSSVVGYTGTDQFLVNSGAFSNVNSGNFTVRIGTDPLVTALVPGANDSELYLYYEGAVEAVPEPSTLFLGLLGLVGLAMVGRRRRCARG